MPAQLLITTGTFVLLALPGVAAVYSLDRRSNWARVFALGNVVGLGAAILLGYYVLLAHLPLACVLAIEYACAVILIIWTRQSRQGIAREEGGGGLYLGIVLLLIFVSRAIPTFFNELPQGLTDPPFHTLIAEKILLTGRIPTDWQPFETIRLNYPVGIHIMIAEIAKLTNVPVHVVFKMLFPILGVGSALSVFSLARVISRRADVAVYSALAYSFLAVWGSIDYYRWGGMPNLAGMLFVLALADLLLAGGRWTFPVFGFLAASLALTHHHSVLCAVILFVGYAFFRLASRRVWDQVVRTTVLGSVMALGLAAPFLIPYAAGAVSEVGKTSVLKFYEPLLPIWQCFSDLGWPLAILGIAGIVVAGRALKDGCGLFLLFWSASFFGVFVFLEYIYRFAVYLTNGGFYTAFTPSRFLTDLAYPLSVAAGIVLARLALALRPGRVFALILVLALAWSVAPIRSQTKKIEVDIATFRWLGANAEANALVVTNVPWASYLTWRETTYTPLPASEARNKDSIIFKRDVLTQDWDRVFAFQRETKRPLYFVLPPGMQIPRGLREVYSDTETRIYELQ